MKITIQRSTAVGTVIAPPSKSASHRALICAGLADGESILRGISRSDDIHATAECLSALGASVRFDGDTALVKGCDPARNDGRASLPCYESGSTLRFLIPTALLSGAETTFYGSRRLFSRPLDVYEQIARERSIRFENDGEYLTVCGKLTPGEYRVSGEKSSQFVTGFLFALPLLDGDSKIVRIPPLTSKPYTEMTVAVMEQFGVKVARPDKTVFAVPGRQVYFARDYAVEGDWSGAAFMEALNTIGGKVGVTGLSRNSLQGDRVAPLLMERMMKGFCEIDLCDCPDLGPILFCVAAMTNGAVFTGTRRLRFKETDRIATMTAELKKCNVEVISEDDRVTVKGGTLRAPTEALEGHNDHRVVMSLCVLLSAVGGSIRGAEAVKKSYPDFFRDLSALGIALSEEEA